MELGTVNNLGYVVVNSCAQQICESFQQPKLLGLVLWFNAGFGLFIRMFHSAFMLKMSFNSRMLIVTVVYIAGLIGCAFSEKVNIWFAFVMIMLVGGSSNLGESIIVGYMRLFPPESVGGFSSGTGGAGLLGAALPIFFNYIHSTLMIDFLSLIPTVVIYYLIYVFWVKRPEGAIMPGSKEEKEREEKERTFIEEEEKRRILNKNEGLESESEENTDSDSETTLLLRRRKESSMKRFWRVFKSIISLAIQLMLVYLFEYVATSGAADVAVPKSWRKAPDASFFVEQAYTIINFAYQIGVFISRSSLSCVKIKRVWILTLIQLVNVAFWIFQDAFHFVKPGGVWILFIHSIWVGLMGGAMYVNVFYLILNSNLENHDKELATNIVMMFVTIGITLAAASSLILKMWIFPGVSD